VSDEYSMTHSFPDRRRLLAFLIMIAVAIMIGSLDIYLPALPSMRTYFNTTEFSLQMTLMIGPLGSALVGMFYGRLSDVYGRRPLLFLSFGFFLAGGVACCFATTIEFFFLSRFIQAVGSGGISVLGVVIIGEMFQGIHYAQYMGIYGALFPLVFATAPILGARLTEFFGWQSCFVFIVMAMLTVTGLLGKLLPETLKNDHAANQGGFRELVTKSKMLLRNRQFILLALGHSLPISMTSIFTSNASFIFIDSFKFTPTVYSVLQSVPIMFNFAGVMIYRKILPSRGLKGTLRIGLAGISLFLLCALAVICRLVPATVFFIIAIICLVNLSISFVIASCATSAFELFPDDRGLSVSTVALTRNLIFSVVVSVSALFFNGTIYPVFTAMALVSVTVITVLVTILQTSGSFSYQIKV
jgi:DHA1 family bicyclomycin/chloramphenicol resistance-like MFS transporter